MSRSCKECAHINPNYPSDLAYACLNCSWPTFAGEPTNFKSKHTTNADRIRAMTDEELAEFIRDQIIDRNIGIPSETWLYWLRLEVDNG